MSKALALGQSPPPAVPDPEAVQRLASDPAASVWVGASAGSGKTTVLTSRVLRLLLEGVEPQKILCLTFTRAAAAEMAIRVTQSLGRWATCSDGELRENLDRLQGSTPEPEQLEEARRLFARVLSCPGGMRIRTIHAFGQEILRRFPLEAGVAPHFAVIEEDDARALQEEVQTELLQAAADGAPDGALRLLAREIGERGFTEAMRGILADRARFAKALAKAGSAEKLGREARRLLDLDPDDSEDGLRREAVIDGNLPRADMLRAAETLLKGSKSFAARGQAMSEWLALPPPARADAFEGWRDFFLTGEGEPFKNFANKELLAGDPGLDRLLRREATRLQSALERIEAARMADTTAALLALGAELLRRYEARKTATALLDYDDLIVRAEALLRRPGIGPWVLYKLDGGIDHILVDEAQDTSRAQWNIVAALAEEFFAGLGARDDDRRTMFAVGDEKQSIFSFQHADPAAFAAMRGFFARRIVDAERPWREVPLHMSFRSAPAILRAVDAVFADAAAHDGVSLVPVEHYPAPRARNELPKVGRVEVWPLVPAAEKEEAGEWTPPAGYEKERDPQAELAASIAARVRTWLDSGEMLESRGRPVEPGDVMILLRRRGRFADLMVRALKANGVPVTGVDRMKLVKQLPVMDLLALVQFALLPEDDLNLAAVLRGPLLNVSEDRLMRLAIGRKGSLWQSLAAQAKKNPAFRAAHEYLANWLGRADLMTPFAMLAHALSEPCPGSRISGRRALWARLGPDALDPVDELLNAAQEFGRRHAPSLQAFLHWLTAAETEIKRELDRGGRNNDGGQVRIMTVHAAKGLEAPIVFLPDTAETPRARELPRWLWDASETPLYAARRPGSGAARRRWDEARQKQMQEYRRLLYVALTRAADRLYVAGWEPSRGEGENADESWYALASRALRPLHEPAAAKEEPPPIIAFADPALAVPADGRKAGKKGGGAGTEIRLPAWARRQAPAEPAAPRPVAPSKLAALEPSAEMSAASPDRLFARGRIIHRLLQSLPDITDAKRDAAAARFLASRQHRLKPAEQKEIAAEVLTLLRNPAYAPLFASGSRAEAALAGRIGREEISGQVDRLCLRGKEVWIVDYKSNRPPPAHARDVPDAYRKQLEAYRAVLRKIYPGRPVRCFLLWTYGPKLMEIPAKILGRV